MSETPTAIDDDSTDRTNDDTELESEAERMHNNGLKRAELTLELDTAFLALLELEAKEQDRAIEDLAESWLRSMWTERFKHEYRDLTCNAEIGIPADAWRRAELYAASSDGRDVSQVLFDHVCEIEPIWTVDGRPMNLDDLDD